MALDKMKKEDIEGIVSDAVSEAIDFMESEIVSDRIKSQRYFDGEVDIGEEEGRSKIVSTKVRDVVRSIKPSLMRVFLSSEHPVEYIPSSQEDISLADQATRFAHWKFQELDGYKLLNEVIHDALVKKTGILKIYWEDYADAKIHSYSNLTEEELTLIVGDKNVTVLEHEENKQTGMYSLKIAYSKETGKLCIESVPPEEFIVDRNAKSVDDAYCVAHKIEMRVGDLVAMGYDFEEISELAGTSSNDNFSSVEKYERGGYSQDDEEQIQDPSMEMVEVIEAYMKMDVYGSGQATMHKFTLAGGERKLLDYEPWGIIPFAVFEVDPEPHTFFGRSIADLIMNDQDSSTAMLRGLLDNIALTNNPSLDVLEGQANIDDVLNNEIGSIRRIKSIGAIQANAIPFVAGQTLTAIQYMDEQTENKTGVTKASMGLDPDALQNSTATAAALTAQAGAGQVEVIARNLAEGGMKRLFKLILELLVENTCEETMMRLNGEYIPIDPRSWNSGMDISINVGLGTGREEQKHAALTQALTMQMQIWSNYGPTNGLVTMTGIRNTLADMLVIGGVRNIDRYFNPMTREHEQQLMQQAQQAKEGQSELSGDAQAVLQAEAYKTDKKAETDQMKMQIDAQKALAQDDRERDKMDQDLIINAAKILGDHGTKVDIEKLRALQNRDRQQNEPSRN